MTAARFINITQKFGDFVAVDDISLEIPKGELTTLLGPSGCGKTTSLRMLAGFLAPTSGQIHIHGRDATRIPPEKRNLGMVFQSYALFPHMTVVDNVAFGLKVRKVGSAQRRARAMAALELVGLAHQAQKKPKQLSGGQQQRIALARAIAIEPELLLLDEPLSNLDARLRIQMRAEIRRIQAETGLTVVLVTHDQDEALEMSDEMVLMKDGRIQQHGAPKHVFRHPANEFVAEFLGYENFITTRAGDRLTIRPEHLRILPEHAQVDRGLDLVLEGVVTDVAYRGVDVIVAVDARTEGGNVRLLADLRAIDAAELAPGQNVLAIAGSEHTVTLNAPAVTES